MQCMKKNGRIEMNKLISDKYITLSFDPSVGYADISPFRGDYAHLTMDTMHFCLP